jgi:hypothetical protein
VSTDLLKIMHLTKFVKCIIADLSITINHYKSEGAITPLSVPAYSGALLITFPPHKGQT